IRSGRGTERGDRRSESGPSPGGFRISREGGMKVLVVLLCLAASLGALGAAPARHVPTVDELLTVQTVGSVQISPDGSRVAYLVTAPDFKQDAFVSQVWVVNAATGEAAQITRGEKGASSPKWSPDSQWLAFLSNRVGDKNQIFAIRVSGGESAQLTKSETAVLNFAWSPDGKSIAFTANEPDSQARKDRKEHLADYELVRGDYAFPHLFTLDVAAASKAPVKGTQRTKGTSYAVNGFSWAPDGTRIAFAGTKNPDLIQGVTSDVYVLT